MSYKIVADEPAYDAFKTFLANQNATIHLARKSCFICASTSVTEMKKVLLQMKNEIFGERRRKMK